MSHMDRREYVSMYGSTGDQVRLGDTDLWIEVEEDRTVGGDEVGFGGGKTIRETALHGPGAIRRALHEHAHLDEADLAPTWQRWRDQVAAIPATLPA
ncbi:MAG: hypothetical protein ACTMHL_14680 [Janibacter sp.]